MIRRRLTDLLLPTAVALAAAAAPCGAQPPEAPAVPPDAQRQFNRQVGGLLQGLFRPPQPPRPAVAVVRGDDVPAYEPTTYITDQRLKGRLDQARSLLAYDQVPAAVTAVQEVLDQGAGFHVRGPDGQWRSVRAVAEELVVSGPPERLAVYREQFGPRAADMLRRAEATGDRHLLAQVADRYFLTAAGGTALARLSAYQLDRGRPALALEYLNRLFDSSVHRPAVDDRVRIRRALLLGLLGRERAAREALAALGPGDLRVGGRFVDAERLLAEAADVGDLRTPPVLGDDWPLLAGAPDRTAVADSGLPLLNAGWQLRRSPGPEMEAIIDQVTEYADEARRPLIPGCVPVRLGERLFVRDLAGTYALDLSDGRVLWQRSESSAARSLADPSLGGSYAYTSSSQQNSKHLVYLSNTVYGSLTAAADLVYQIDELALSVSLYVPRTIGGGRGNALLDRGRNRIAALDAATGALRWTRRHDGPLAGLPPTPAPESPSEGLLDRLRQVLLPASTPPTPQPPAEDTPPELPPGAAPVFFLGPPLPTPEALYVVGEVRSELRLFALEPATGDLLWTLPLAMSERRIQTDQFRQSQAAHLAFGDGLLVCTTNQFRTVAVDPLTRQVAWTYTYADDRLNSYRIASANSQYVSPPSGAFSNDPPVIAEGRVYLASAVARSLHCIDLYSGERLWTADRSDYPLFAGLAADRLLLLGSGRAVGLDAATGKVAWSRTFPAGSSGGAARPSGRGVFVTGDDPEDGPQYLQPLEDGRVVSVLAADGTPGEVAAARHATPVGNLIATADAVAAVDHTSVRSFPLLRRVRRLVHDRLAADGDDPLGLFRRGQLRLADDSLVGAVSDLTRALDHAGDAHAPAGAELRERIVAFLFDVAANEAIARPRDAGTLLTHLRPLADGPQRQGVYLRLKAEAAVAADAVAAALAQVAAHDRLGLDEWIDTPDDNVRRRPDAWASDVLHRLEPSGPLPDLLRAQLALATQTGNDSRLRRLSRQRPASAVGAEASLLLADRAGAEDPATAAAYLHRATAAEETTLAEAAWRGLADLADDRDLPRDADWYRTLAGRPESLPAATPPTVRPQDDPLVQWPYDVLHLAPATVAEAGRDPSLRVVPLESAGLPPSLAEMTVRYDGTGPRLRCDAGSDETLVVEDLPELEGAPRSFAHVGHLLVLAQDDAVYALSLLDRKLQWTTRLEGVATGAAAGRLRVSFGGGSVGSEPLGPCGATFVTVRHGKRLWVLDPATGRPLWTLPDLRPYQSLLADDDAVLVIDSRTGSFVARRTADGARVESGRIEDFRTKKAAVGHQILLVSRDGQRQTARRIDARTGVTLWQHEFPSRARTSLTASPDGHLLAILAADGEFVLFDWLRGERLLADRFDAATAADLARLSVFADAARWYVALHSRRNDSLSPRATPGLTTFPVAGPLRAYRRSDGTPLWQREAETRHLVGDAADRLPVLVGYGIRRGKDRRPTTTVLEILDKKDGRTLARHEFPGGQPFSSLTLDHAARTAELQGKGVAAKLSFLTAAEAERQGIEPAGVEQDPPPRPQSPLPSADRVLDAMRNAFRRQQQRRIELKKSEDDG